MQTKPFLVPFANSGDKTAVPVAVQPSGVVSYESGWGFDYQRTLGTDPSAKPVSRQASNQLLYDVTSSLGALQKQAFPQFITSADNGGAPYSYGKGVVVQFDTGGGVFEPYVSLVAANVTTPGSASWQKLIFAEASLAQAQAGTDATTLMTPRRVAAAIAALGAAVPQATTSVVGITRYATGAEAVAGTVTDAAVTPAALQAAKPVQASSTVTGITRYATAAEVTAGAAVTAAVLPYDAMQTFFRRAGDTVNNGTIEIARTPAVNADAGRTFSVSEFGASGEARRLDVALQVGGGSTSREIRFRGIQTGTFTFEVPTAAFTSSVTIGNNCTITGNASANGYTSQSGQFAAAGGTMILGTTPGGTIYLRPNGAGSSAGQLTVNSGGLLTVPQGSFADVFCTSFRIPSGGGGATLIYRDAANTVARFYQAHSDATWSVNSCDDAGAYAGTPLSINRTSLTTTFAGAVVANGGFQNGSSRELKTEVGPIENALDKVLALRPVVAVYHEDYCAGGRERLSLIAEEVGEVVPQMERTEAIDYHDRKVSALDYDQGVPLLVAAVHELTAKLEAALARITELETER